MTLVCLAFLISLHSLSFFSLLSLPSHSPRPLFSSFSSSAYPSLFFLLSLSLSGCPLADKSLRSLMAAHTPELKYVCSTPSLPSHCHFNALLLTPSNGTMLYFADVNLSFVTGCCLCCCYLCHSVFFFFCIRLGLCLLLLQSVHIDVKWQCRSDDVIAQ